MYFPVFFLIWQQRFELSTDLDRDTGGAQEFNLRIEAATGSEGGAVGVGKACCGQELCHSGTVPIIIDVQCINSRCNPFGTAFTYKVTELNTITGSVIKLSLDLNNYYAMKTYRKCRYLVHHS